MESFSIFGFHQILRAYSLTESNVCGCHGEFQADARMPPTGNIIFLSKTFRLIDSLES